jgi:hypothetical protein
MQELEWIWPRALYPFSQAESSQAESAPLPDLLLVEASVLEEFVLARTARVVAPDL